MMNEPSSVYEDGLPNTAPMVPEAQPAHPPGKPFPDPYRFSADELRVLRECNQESFFQRSLPLATAMGLTTMLSVQKGYLRANARFGAAPKVTLAVVIGYFVGKLSYQEKCAEKLMALPGSFLGQLLKEKKAGKMTGVAMKKGQPPTMFGASPNDIYSDAGPGSSLDLDTDRPLFNDDSFRPGSDVGTSAPPTATDPNSPQGPSLTYEELRRQNRGQKMTNKPDPYRFEPSVVPPPPRRPPPEDEEPKPRPRINKYGDMMD